MAIELPKTFDPSQAQKKWLAVWEQRGYFHSDPDPHRQPFSIVIPPPNVTGALHMGHALNNTLQDVLIRWRRMQGYNALWIPGTDHAGIATQSVVERLIFTHEKKTRHDLGRAELVKRIWAWKDKYEARILEQLQALGASCDWRRTRFTLDPVCARAVRETFFRMFRAGYIYRGQRLVNWDTQLQTSVADDETYTEETPGSFWTFRYPVDGQPGVFIAFSTTRPETMLGDTALCVHPADERYKHLIGQHVIQPHTGRKIPIIADGLLADPTLGTGCVKVTPAHDPNDYACWQRHPEIGIINILNPDGTINDNGGEYRGMDRYKAREAVTHKMQELGLYVGQEQRIIPLKFSDRSKTPIEPYLSDQWFVKMSDRDDGQPGLAQMTMDAVTTGRVKFFPERYARSYLDWLAEKRDWCISRQLWWGHQIPVWYKTEQQPPEVFRMVAEPTPRALQPFLRTRPGIAISWQNKPHRAADDFNVDFVVCLAPGNDDIEAALEADGFTRDPDVLDTWFSSALWPHSTLGWPGPTLPENRPDRTPADWEKLRQYYPTSTLVTSRDIITLWVARMVLMGLYNVGEIPFHHVYIHPKILDGFGETMSKTKGNGVDPLDIIEIYGTDALRYGIVKIATETQDARLPVSNICPHCGQDVPVKQEHMYMRTKKLACPACKKEFRPGGPWPTDDPERPTAKQGSDRFEEGRNFANKLWNAARFLLLNLEGYRPAPVDPAALPTEDRWLLSRLATTTQAVTAALEAYKFSDVARLIYEFVWSEFCDWYIEMSKGRLKDDTTRPVAQRVLAGAFDGILRLVHPVMPFVSESLWEALGQAAPQRGLPAPTPAEEAACIARWPSYPQQWISPPVETRFARMQHLVRGVREIRNRYQVEEKIKLDVRVKCSDAVAADFNALAAFIGPLAGIATLTAGPQITKPRQSGTLITAEFEAYVPLAGLIDPVAEAKRLEKQLADKRKALENTQNKLRNEKFVANAPAEVVQQQREFVAEIEKQIALLEENLKDLQSN
ncbi:MAG: valine--tRNA ligase [Gemmataceae bacterium]|nr:valine--tRNA ligase [Gemmata sp.]MDW8199055.1 valine--tRNA ligase [Gemmataceae bacterium]